MYVVKIYKVSICSEKWFAYKMQNIQRNYLYEFLASNRDQHKPYFPVCHCDVTGFRSPGTSDEIFLTLLEIEKYFPCF